MMGCTFCKIINGEMGELIYEDNQVVAFNDQNPAAPIHILIIPRQHIATVNDTTETDEAMLGRLVHVAKQLAEESNVDNSGYRLVFNCNRHGGQEIYHLHLHLLGNRQMTWPPG